MIMPIIIGRERSGKTTYAKSILENSGKPIFAYNVGDPSDFPNYEFISIVGSEKNKSIGYKSKKTLFFTDGKRIFSLKDLGKFVHKYKRVAAYREFSNENEKALIRSIYKFVGNTSLLIDDSRALFRSGVKDYFLEIMGRKAHCGHREIFGNGLNIVTVFHSYTEINEAIYTYATHVVLFATNMPPTFQDFYKDSELYGVCKLEFERLRTATKYSYSEIKIKGVEVYEPIKFTK